MTKQEIPRILIVDDNEENLIAAEAILADPGIEIVKADSGRAALRFLLREEFALILLDVKMPEMDGIQTAAMLRLNTKMKNTPIIFMTAFEKDDQQMLAAYNLGGVVDFIFKPVVPEILKAKVAVFVSLYMKTNELKLIADQLKVDIAQRKQAEKALEEERRRLQQALDEVRTLRGIVPICANCKNIRDDKGFWNQVEKYVSERSEAEFSHGICPDCTKILYPDMRNVLLFHYG